jgi:hypothetical protein
MSAVQARGLGIATAGRWLGLLAGLAATSWLISTGDLELALLLSGPLVGIAMLGGVLLGELARPGPERGPARRALLETRRIETYLPPWARLVRWLAVTYVVLVVCSVLLGRPEHFTGAGAAPETTAIYVCGDGFGLSGVWLPPAYAIPALTVVLIGLAAAVGALHLLVRRPRPAGIDVADDDRARTDGAAAVVAAGAVLVSVPLAGLSLLAAASLAQSCSGPLGQLAAAPLLCLTVAAAAIGCWALGGLLVPRWRGRA